MRIDKPLGFHRLRKVSVTRHSTWKVYGIQGNIFCIISADLDVNQKGASASREQTEENKTAFSESYQWVTSIWMLFYLHFPLHLCSNKPVKNTKCNFCSQRSRFIIQIGKELLQNKNFINAPSTKLNSLFTCRERNHVKWEHAPRVNHIIHHCWLIVKTAVGDQNKHRKTMLLFVI